MGYKVEIIEPFRKAAKKLIRKYPSLKDELAELGQQLSDNPTQGAALGNDCYKVRLLKSLIHYRHWYRSPGE